MSVLATVITLGVVACSGVTTERVSKPSADASLANESHQASPVSRPTGPYLYVLGIAQDAGYPQAGCYAPHCLPGWEQPDRRLSAASLGLIHRNRAYLFEATPNLPAQLYRLYQEAPQAAQPVSGVFLTHAHIGHYAGLMFFGHEAMGARNVPIYAMPRMSDFLRNNGPWSQLVEYHNIRLRALAHERTVDLDGSLSVTPFLVPHRDEYSETVGYRIASATHSAVFIPDINKWEIWDQDLVALVKAHDYALLDATFYANGELPGRDMSQIPHPFVTETMQALSSLPREARAKVWFIHMNHTNPMLRPDSQASRDVLDAGFNIAREGDRLRLYPVAQD